MSARPEEVSANPNPLSAALLNIEYKSRSNLLPWRGQFSPQLIQAFLQEYASANSHVLDPFAGSGTVLYECGTTRLQCTGTELNPGAYNLAQIYELINCPRTERRELVRPLGRSLSTIVRNSATSLDASSCENLTPGLAPKILEAYGKETDDTRRMVWETYIILLDLFKNDITPSRVMSTWRKLEVLIGCLPYSENSIRVSMCDVRALTLGTDTVDLIITSPPYINVFNYHQQYRRSVEALGWNPLVVAASEFGANRKFRGNRYLTVVQYCLDMYAALGELQRVCKANAHLVFVLGRESNVRKTPFRNGHIFRNLATRCAGFKNTLNQERVFSNKYGQRIFEDIIHLTPGGGELSRLESPRQVALEALEGAVRYAPEESRSDLAAAIRSVDSVEPSPLLDLVRARQA